MRISDVFVAKPLVKKRLLTRSFLLIGALITGLISTVVIFVTIYGQYTGTFTLSMQRDALDKGIQISETADFKDPKSILKINPLTEIGEITEANLKIGEARETDGQYYDPDIPYYIAYTFYLKNSGKELIDLNYRLRIIDSYKGAENAVKVKYMEENLSNGLLSDNTYTKPEGKHYIFDNNLYNFLEGEIYKITMFMWFDGELTDISMLGGGVKLDLSFTIISAEQDND